VHRWPPDATANGAVAGTADGEGVNPPSTTSGTPAPGARSLGANDGWTPGSLRLAKLSLLRHFFVTVEDNGSSVTSFNVYIFPCQRSTFATASMTRRVTEVRIASRMNRGRWIAAGAVVAALALAAFLALRGGGSPSQLPSLTVIAPAAAPARETMASTAPDHRAGDDHTIKKNATSTAAATWTAKFRSSDDYLKFVIDALPAARSGDGRAAWYIGEALASCALVMKTYRGGADPEAQLNQELANMPKAPQWGRDLLAQKTHRCLGLAGEDPFAGLPPREGVTGPLIGTTRPWRMAILLRKNRRRQWLWRIFR
jgi:hypothetical protein